MNKQKDTSKDYRVCKNCDDYFLKGSSNSYLCFKCREKPITISLVQCEKCGEGKAWNEMSASLKNDFEYVCKECIQ